MAHTFSARYPGECNGCGAEFDEGDPIGYVDDEINCEDCCEGDDEFAGLI